MFYPGQFVVCVEMHGWWDPNTMEDVPDVSAPRYGVIYTIARAFLDDVYSPTVDLVEIADPDGWAASSFRPVQDEKLSVFRALLAPKQTETV